MFPGMGGDSVILPRGRSTLIFDIGDVETGETLKTHDRLIISQASSDKFDISRKGHSLLLCAPDYGYAITILRQFCHSDKGEPLWNHAIEEITFASGETWLSDHLYHQLDLQHSPVYKSFMTENGLYSGFENYGPKWQFHKFSDKLPAAGNYRKFCAADQNLN